MKNMEIWSDALKRGVRMDKLKFYISAVLLVVCLFSLAGCSGSVSSDYPKTGEIFENAQANTEVLDESEAHREDGVEPSNATSETSATAENDSNVDMEGNTMRVTVGDTVLTATLADNSSAQALKDLLAERPLTINMSDYGNMEKVGPIGQSLPENNEQITTEAGDIILYLGNSLVIYYDTNSWNFTRIGKINDVTQEELKSILGEGNVTVTFEFGEK